MRVFAKICEKNRTNRQTGRRTDRQTDRQADRQVYQSFETVQSKHASKNHRWYHGQYLGKTILLKKWAKKVLKLLKFQNCSYVRDKLTPEKISLKWHYS